MSNSEKLVHYDDPGVEPPIPNEEELINDIISLIHRVQSHNFSMHRHGFRGTHVKTQGVVKGELTILPDLSDELAQGLCSPANQKLNGGKETWCLGPRGCGLKIFDVTGDFLEPMGKTHTQDMTFNNAPILELTDLPTTVEIFQIRERNFRTPGNISEEVKKRDDAELQMAPTQLPNHHFLGYTMYSQSAYRWGPYVAKYALFPTGKLQEELSKRNQISDQSDPEQHSMWLREYFQQHDATYDLRVQLCENLTVQSVEKCSMEWDEEKFPFKTVAQLAFPHRQDSFDSARRTFWEDKMKLNIWYGLREHQPLGSVNRLRKRLYQESQKFRSELNNTEAVYVDSIDQIP